MSLTLSQKVLGIEVAALFNDMLDAHSDYVQTDSDDPELSKKRDEFESRREIFLKALSA